MNTVLLVAALLVAGASAQGDPCEHWGNCQKCVDDVNNRCGWCSSKVHYTKSGLTGGNCVSNNGSFPFRCDGVFSKLACEPGWKCDMAEHKCKLSPPGTGTNFFKCLEKCGLPPSPEPPLPPTPPPAKVYACNHTSFKCYLTAPGTGKSREFCEAECKMVPPSPAVPSTPTAPLNTYLCNHTNFKCVQHPEGASKLSCEGHCQRPPNAKFRCDRAAEQCVFDPSGIPYPKCEEECQKLYTCDLVNEQCLPAKNPHEGIPLGACKEFCQNGNYTPEGLLGTWRGIQINTGFAVGEWDVDFYESSMQMAGPVGTINAGLTFSGTTKRRLMTAKVSASSVQVYPKGSVFQAVFSYDTASPETVFLMMAAAPVGQPAPANWRSAVSSSSGFAWTMSACQPETKCNFTYHEPALHMRQVYEQSLVSSLRPRIDPLSTHVIPTEDEVKAVEQRDGVAAPAYYDPCEHYDTCTGCLEEAKCGWCSGTVIYKGKIPGKHCVGGGYRNITFRCHGGTYRTDSCSTYGCIKPQNVCKVVGQVGNTTQKQCEATCGKAPPSPAPSPFVPLPTYSCNHKTYQCYEDPNGVSKLICDANCHAPHPSHPSAPAALVYKCNSTFLKCDTVPPGTPGATSKEICEGFCNPPPPPPILVGHFRGIQTDNDYIYGEVDWAIGATGMYTVKTNGKFVSSGRIIFKTAEGAILIIPEKGQGAGRAFAGIYTIEVGDVLTYITLVLSNNAESIPKGWDVPWILGGKNGHEYVLTRATRAEDQ